MSTSDKLNYLIETKNQIKTAIQNKGVSIANDDTFRSYANKISQISGSSSDEWQPEPDWWDIKSILENDSEESVQKAIFLLSDSQSSSSKIRGFEKYKLSDGQIIESSADNELNLTNLFDASVDKVCSKGYKTRYIIAYFNHIDTPITKLISPDNSIYIIFSKIKYKADVYGSFKNKYMLQAVEFINNCEYLLNSAAQLFQQCYCLQKVSGLDISNITNTSAMFGYCYSLKTNPILDMSNISMPPLMFKQCYSLKEISELDLSNTTNALELFSDCYCLQTISELNMSNVTVATNMFKNCTNLINISNITQIKISLDFNNCIYLNHSTLLRILNALVDLTGQDAKTLTLGTTNLSKLTDEEKATATNKNWVLA